MKLAIQLSVVLCALILLIVCGTLWSSHRSERRHLEESQDNFVLAGLRALSEACQRPLEEQPRCLQALHFFVRMSPSQAFKQVLLLDHRSRVIVDSRALSGERGLRGALLEAGYLRQMQSRREPQILKNVMQDDALRRMYSIPVALPEGVGTLLAIFDERSLRGNLGWLDQDARRRLLQVGLMGVGFGILFSVLWVLYCLAPLHALVGAARRVAAGDFASRVPEGRDDELGHVAAEFNRMARRLQELDDMKDRFMAQITHDLRNPLMAMIGYAELSLGGYRGALTPEQTESLQVIARNGSALADLINNILDVSKLESKRMNFSPTAMDLRHEIDSVLELLKVRADQYKIRLESQLAPDAVEAYADPQAFRRVLTNLVSNALKFTPEGGRVLVGAARPKPGEISISVSDSGIGIPPDRLGDLFKKFSQIPETRNKVRPSGGTGLGLVICKEIVEAHGGRIGVKSPPGEGATFFFSLPEKAPA